MATHNKTVDLGQMAEKALNEGVKKALLEHKRLGVPAVYMRNGKIVYLLPSGKVVSTPPKTKMPKIKR
ncbi:hypothetical protein HZC34_07165 [Candidatus Saganbacteria bacterium]|nr:hypothetical protein [Candidatus Saganbacteria bacterium]